MKRKFFVRVLFGVMALLMLATACAKPVDDDVESSTSPDSSGTPVVSGSPVVEGGVESDETLVVAIGGEPVRLTCLNSSPSNNDVTIGDTMWGTLFEMNYETYEAEPALATSWEEIDDTHYRIFLREDACFADGSPLTAEDVVWTFKRYAEVGVQFATYFDPEGIVAEDEHTLILAYKTHTPGWYNELIREGIYSQEAVEAAGGFDAVDRTPPMGCGKYNFVEWVPGQHILVERNENYWDDEWTGYYKYIEFIFVGDAASRLMAVQSGDANVALSLSMSQVLPLENNPSADAVIEYVGTVYNLYFNCESGIFTDPKVREAVSYLIDSEAVNQLVNMGRGEVVQGYIPEENPFYTEYYPGGVHPYDVEKAKELLAEAGYPDGFEISMPCNVNYEAVAVIIQECLRAANITLNINVLDPSVNVQELRAGNYDISVATSSNPVVKPDNFELCNPAKVGITNGGMRIVDPAMNEIIERTNSADSAEQAQGWEDAINYIFDNHSMVGLCQSFECHAVSPGLVGLQPLVRTSQISVTDIHPTV